jgi:hypothetical protein
MSNYRLYFVSVVPLAGLEPANPLLRRHGHENAMRPIVAGAPKRVQLSGGFSLPPNVTMHKGRCASCFAHQGLDISET